jgi:hypothetical protein
MKRKNREMALVWKSDHRIKEGINRFYSFNKEFLFGLSEKGILYVFDVSKTSTRGPYSTQLPRVYEDLIDIAPIEGADPQNRYFISTRNGLYIVTIDLVKPKN